jgi:hypothetical protein
MAFSPVTKPSTTYTDIQVAENYLLINATDFLLINATDKLVTSNAKQGGFDDIYTTITKPV